MTTSSSKRFLYLPSDYKKRTNTTVEGIAKSGEVSKQGIVSHREDWEGRVASAAAPTALRYLWDSKGNRLLAMTHEQQVERGYFIPGRGPVGVRLQREGIR